MKVLYNSRDLFFLTYLLVGYVFASMLSNFFIIEEKLFSYPYRISVFIFSLIILLENRKNLKSNYKILILLFLFWIFYTFKVFYTFSLDYFVYEFLIYENEIYARIFLVNLIPSLALVSIDYSKLNFKALVNNLFKILFFCLTINLLFTLFYSQNYNSSSGVFSVYYISSGHFGASLIILSSYFLLFKTHENFKNKKILISGILLGIFAVYISAARSPILAIIVVLLYFIFLKHKVKYIIYVLFLVLFLVLSIYISRQFFNNESAFVTRNYVAIFEGNSSGRELLFSKSFPIIKNNLLFGKQILYEDGVYPHNIFLELLMSGGMVSLLLFGLIFFPLCKQISFYIKFSDSKFYILPIFALWLQYFILSQTSLNLYSNAEFWYFSMVVISISIHIYNEKIKSNDGSRNPSGNNTII